MKNLIIFLLIAAATQLPAQDSLTRREIKRTVPDMMFSGTNRFSGDAPGLTNVFDRLTQQPTLWNTEKELLSRSGFNILWIGDSLLTGGFNTPANSVFKTNALARFGVNGWFGNVGGGGNYGDNFVISDREALTFLLPGWLGMIYAATNGGPSATFYPNIGDGYCLADTISVPYMMFPGAATMRIESVTSSGATTLADINCAAASTNMMSTNITVATGRYRIRLSATTAGAVMFGAPGAWRAAGSGVRYGWIGTGGVDSWGVGYRHMWTNALKGYAPTLAIFQQTGGGSDINNPASQYDWLGFIRTCANLWTNRADIVVLGVEKILATNSIYAAASDLERRLTAAYCATNGWRFIDLANLAPPYDVATNLGWMPTSGDVHPQSDYACWLSQRVWDELGMASLRAPLAQTVAASSFEFLEPQAWQVGANAAKSTGGSAVSGYLNGEPYWVDWIVMADNAAGSGIYRSANFGFGYTNFILTAIIGWTNSVSCQITNDLYHAHHGVTRSLGQTTSWQLYTNGVNFVRFTNYFGNGDSFPRSFNFVHRDNTNGGALYYLGGYVQWF